MIITRESQQKHKTRTTPTKKKKNQKFTKNYIMSTFKSGDWENDYNFLDYYLLICTL